MRLLFFIVKGFTYVIIKQINKLEFVELVNLDFGKYKNVSHYGFNAVCKEK